MQLIAKVLTCSRWDGYIWSEPVICAVFFSSKAREDYMQYEADQSENLCYEMIELPICQKDHEYLAKILGPY